MQFCHHYCCDNDKKIPKDVIGFKKLLYKIWFELYSRSRNGKKDSSGFEHVFVGEVKETKDVNGKATGKKEVSGFHNWIQFYYEEKKGTSIDYKGYIKPRGKQAATNEDDHILTLQFSWGGVMKNVGTSIIGSSPEFEVGLYTMCFLVGQENNRLHLHTGTDLFELNIKCFKMAHDKVGTSFPECLDHHEAIENP
jgi:poly(U)-specific endoribonuclease